MVFLYYTKKSCNFATVPLQSHGGSVKISLRQRILRGCVCVGTDQKWDTVRHGAVSLKTLGKWLLIGTMVGLIVGTVGSAFAHALSFVNGLRGSYPAMVLGLPLAGLLIVFLYRVCKNTGDRGTNTVIEAVHSSKEIPLRMAPLIFISTVLTHMFGGSAGREGAALQLGGSIANRMGRVMKLSANDRHTIVMCGMSAGFSALFGTPLAAAVFSLEVISIGIMHYSALVPCVIASLTAQFVARFFRVPPEVFPVAEVPALGPVLLLKVVVFAAVVGLVSILFCLILHKAEHLYQKWLKNPYLRIAVAGCLVAALAYLLGTHDYLGSGMGIIEHIFHEGEAHPLAFLLKILFTALTLGAGFKGGEIVPSFTIGAAFGCAVAALVGLPVPLAAACGMVGVFCGVTNSPITSLLIGFELFGFAGMPYYLVTVAVSYMMSGNFGLYRSQRLMYSKTETRFINSHTH